MSPEVTARADNVVPVRPVAFLELRNFGKIVLGQNFLAMFDILYLEHDHAVIPVFLKRNNTSTHPVCSAFSISTWLRGLFHEPPYTEPYVRWCGRTAGLCPPPTRWIDLDRVVVNV